MDTRTILLDIGGTFIKCSDGREIPIDSAGTREEIVSSLKEAVADYEFAAAAVPGPFDYAIGTFLMKHKFAAVYGENFGDIVGQPMKNLRLAHDVYAMLAGEMFCGAAAEYCNVALVTLGTGLGFALSKNGKIQTNEMLSPSYPIYNLPYRDGILEDYVSKRGFLRGMEGITVKELAEKARGGDSEALARFRECGEILAEALTPILTEHHIECLLFGGQISRSFDLLDAAVRAGLTSVASLRHIGPVSDIDNATFNGLKTLFNQ